MTLICVLGTDLSARLQNILIGAQVGALLLFAAVALAKVAGGDAPEGSLDPSLSLAQPVRDRLDERAHRGPAHRRVHLLGLGERRQPHRGGRGLRRPRRAARRCSRRVILLVTYVSVAIAVVAFAGLDRIAEFEDDDAILSTLATDVLGTPWDQLVVLAVLTSALASTQTTILPASRTTLSMGRAGAMPHVLASIHPRFQTPHVSTWLIGALASALVRGRQRAVGELPLRHALGAVADDRVLLRAQRDRVRRLLPPRADQARSRTSSSSASRRCPGRCILSYLLVRSVIDLSDPEASYSGQLGARRRACRSSSAPRSCCSARS